MKNVMRHFYIHAEFYKIGIITIKGVREHQTKIWTTDWTLLNITLKHNETKYKKYKKFKYKIHEMVGELSVKSDFPLVQLTSLHIELCKKNDIL